MADGRGYAAIGLFQPKTNANVGGVLRAAHCFDVSMVVVEGRRYERAPTDTVKAYKHIPLVHGDLHDCIPFDCVPVAVELSDGAMPLWSFSHPERCFYVFGPEDGSLPRSVREWCRETLFIPTKGCLNLAATVNVVLYDRMRGRRREAALNRR